MDLSDKRGTCASIIVGVLVELSAKKQTIIEEQTQSKFFKHATKLLILPCEITNLSAFSHHTKMMPRPILDTLLRLSLLGLSHEPSVCLSN